MEKLKSIFKLKFIKNIPKGNKMAYLVSAGMGVGAGILICFLFNISGTEILNSLLIRITISSLIPFLIFILLFILFKKFFFIWTTVKARIICIILLLLGYILGFYLPICFTFGSFTHIFSCIVWLPLMPFMTIFLDIIWSFEYPSQSPLLITFLYSNIFIIIAAYLATKGIANLPKRIILFFIIAFLICATAATPLIMMHGSG